MNGYSSHTFSLVNAKNELFYVKWHFKTKQGIKNFFREQAGALEGTDPDYSQRDLFQAIKEGKFPKWRVCVQIMPEKDAETYHINPFDLTKVWPHADYPPIDIGVLELNRNADNYFAEIEQAAFAPSNIVPGIGFSPDKMLQARIFSYADAHRYRLGTHYEALPVNAPRCPVHHYHKDGPMRFFRNDTGNPDAYYEPNSFNGPAQSEALREPPLKISGDANRYNHRVGNDDYSQPRALFRLLSHAERERLMDNVGAAMQGVPVDIVKRQVALFYRVDPDYGIGVATRMGLSASDVPTTVAAE